MKATRFNYDKKLQLKATEQLPVPRLQLRWAPNTRRTGEWASYQFMCHYELVLPLKEGDIRRESPRGKKFRSVLVVKMKEPALRHSGSNWLPMINNLDGTLYADTPYRDGAHACWDARVLGELPVYVIAFDGRALVYEDTYPK